MLTLKLRGKSIVKGAAGTATRTVGLLGGILTYVMEAGIITANPAHGILKPNPFRQDVTAARPFELSVIPFSTSTKSSLECQKKIHYFLTYENDRALSS